MMVPCTEDGPRLAVIRTSAVVPVGNVLIGKLADVAPPGTLSVAGTEATDGCDEVRLIVTPPSGTGGSNVTVPTDEVPPMTLEGFVERDRNVRG